MAQPNASESGQGGVFPCTYARSRRARSALTSGSDGSSAKRAEVAGQPSPLRFSQRKLLCQPPCPHRGEQGPVNGPPSAPCDSPGQGMTVDSATYQEEQSCSWSVASAERRALRAAGHLTECHVVRLCLRGSQLFYCGDIVRSRCSEAVLLSLSSVRCLGAIGITRAPAMPMIGSGA
jgi:hypothetical protein